MAGDRLGPVVELVEADATALPFADDEFGAVPSSGCSSM